MVFDWSRVHSSWVAFFEKAEPILREIELEIGQIPEDELCPSPELIFRVFEISPLNEVSVLVLGQDPYYNGSANGLAFSVQSSVRPPASLLNIKKEIARDFDVSGEFDIDDLSLTSSKVLWLNASLTTVAGVAGAHQKVWADFSKLLMSFISDYSDDLVILAWGKHAHQVSNLFHSRHQVIKTSHPSPLGCYRTGKDFVSFNGSSCFSSANSLLSSERQVDWLELLRCRFVS